MKNKVAHKKYLSDTNDCQKKMTRINCESCGRFIWLDSSVSVILSAVADTEDGDMIVCGKCSNLQDYTV